MKFVIISICQMLFNNISKQILKTVNGELSNLRIIRLQQ